MVSSYLRSRSHSCGELSLDDVGKVVVLCGWLQYKRLDQFLLLRDWQGITQVLIPTEKQDILHPLLSNLPLESVIQVQGTVIKRPEDQQNDKMQTGSIEVKLSDFHVLNSCRTKLPFQMKKFHEVKESLRMEYRYIDLRTQRMQHNLRLRSAMTMKIREFLCNKHDFVDVETPVLFRRTPGGAKEFIVPTHTPGKFYSLPQSPQQFKQLLMAGGLDRYFQIAKCFRDEGAKPDRQPEFTQVDLEMSFVDMDGILSLTEDMLAASWPDSKQHKLCTPFPRMPHHQALKCFGSDKPDTRFGMELNDISHILQDSGIDFLNTVLSTPAGSVQTIVLKQGTKYLTSKDLRKVKDLGNENTTLAGLTIIVIKDNNQWQSPISNVLQQNLKEELTDSLGLEPGDVVLLAAGIHEHPYSLLGKLRLECANMMESNGMKLRDTEAFNFLWVVDFPLFLPKEDCDGLESAHHPFTAPMPEDVELLYTDPLKVKGQHYDLVLNGHEIGGGSIRIHTAKEQLYILEQILKEDSRQLQHLLHALDSGCPPHGGIALGLDRLLAILCDEPSIRDVIAFPKSHDGKDPMSKAPATVSAEDQNYYHISSKFTD
ncbi:aspartate--tRNA ligase, mitochondrial isoform X2 [Octopus bimaculoides]|nr:aspartate--tRNA ligase, mitochondrial isoform X2 [Octopus bimaculoides]|eukprot:XP_014783490.1 PREDICTED: aspartate--tRNA ligase, mitochondrial-like isoform X2 [Octopus bimaculoides]